MRELVGSVLEDTYRVERLIGQGGMGAVYLAHDLALDRDVAVKVMHDHIAREEGFRSRFLQEARAIAALDHPNIVRVHAFSRGTDLLYIVMSLVGQGHTLSDWLERLSAQGMLLELDEALALIEPLADALGYAHGRGVTHRDIKPGNILLQPVAGAPHTGQGPSVRPILTDFGLAKLAQGAAQTLPGQTMGTPAYMAPEQCLGQPVDGRTDIYSLGIVFYQLVTGRLPFAVHTLPEALQAHTRQAPPPPRMVVSDLPSEVEQVVLTALAKDPAGRQQTGEALRDSVVELRGRYAQRQEDTPTAQPSRASVAWLTQADVAPPPRADAMPTPPSDAPAGAHIVVQSPEGRAERVPLADAITLTVGREADNDLVLPSSAVSRHHARITCEAQRVRVTDLNSTNGTFLESERILPGVAERWPAGRRLRIGGYWLSLEGLAATPTPAPPVATYAGRVAAGGAALEVHISPATLSLAPGARSEIHARILNHQPHVDHFYARIEGLPEVWIALPAEDLMLAPEDGGDLAIGICPPDAPPPPAGEHPFVVHIMSRADATRHAEARGALAIEAQRRLDLGLHPSVYTDQGQGTLSVANRGNTDEQIELEATDPADAVELQFAPATFSLSPGSSQAVAVALKPTEHAPQGLHQTLPFAIRVLVAGQCVASVEGTLTVRPAPVATPPAPSPAPGPAPVAAPAPVEEAPRAAQPSVPSPAPAPAAAPAAAPAPAAEPEQDKRKVGFWRIVLGLLTVAVAAYLLMAAWRAVGWYGLTHGETLSAAGLGLALLVAGVLCLRGRAKLAVAIWILGLGYIAVRSIFG